jgi:hypothetical protein
MLPFDHSFERLLNLYELFAEVHGRSSAIEHVEGLFQDLRDSGPNPEQLDRLSALQAEWDEFVTNQKDLKMFQLAQEITDEVFGKGTYALQNHFDPSKGETFTKA